MNPTTGRTEMIVRVIGGPDSDGSSVDYEFKEDCVPGIRLGTDCDNVRSSVMIKFGPASTVPPSPNALGQEFRSDIIGIPIPNGNQASPIVDCYLDRVKRYGANWAFLCEDSENSPIQEPTQAIVLAQDIYDKIGRPALEGNIVHPYFPNMQLDDIIKVTGCGKKIEEGEEILAYVSGVSHTIGVGKCETNIQFRELVNALDTKGKNESELGIDGGDGGGDGDGPGDGPAGGGDGGG